MGALRAPLQAAWQFPRHRHSPVDAHAGYGCNPDLAHEAVKEHVEPLLKADFRLFETYQPRLAVLPYAVVACAAVGDDRVLDSQLAAWRERCNIASSLCQALGRCLSGGASTDKQRSAYMRTLSRRRQPKATPLHLQAAMGTSNV